MMNTSSTPAGNRPGKKTRLVAASATNKDNEQTEPIKANEAASTSELTATSPAPQSIQDSATTPTTSATAGQAATIPDATTFPEPSQPQQEQQNISVGARARWRAGRARFRLWRRTRPFAGSILMMLAGFLVLLGPLILIQYAWLPGNPIWEGLLVGAVLFLMGLIQLLLPRQAVITGAIGMVLALISLLVTLGGFGIGMILGLLGGALGVAWRPIKNGSAPARTASSLGSSAHKQPGRTA